MISSLEPQEVDVSIVREYAERMGKTNKAYNIYNAALKMYEEYESHGLTPLIYQEVISGGLYVTTEEFMNKKFH